MFDEKHNNQDLMFRSILNEGQEEVPARVWDGVASGLDKLAHRKKVALWWRWAGIGIASAAAAAFMLLLVNPDQPESIDKVDGKRFVAETHSEEIMVVETPGQEVQGAGTYLAFVPKAEAAPEPLKREQMVTATQKERADDYEATPAVGLTPESVPSSEAGSSDNNRTPVLEEPEWVDDETKPKKERKKVSLTISGITGANGGSKQIRPGRLKRPSTMGSTPSTGIVESGDKNNFGPSISFGFGVRIDLAKRWAIGTGVNYTMLYRKFNGTYTKVENGTITERTTSDIRNLQHYVGIPVNVYYNIIKKDKINFYAYGGGAVEKCVANEYKILESSSLYKERVKGVQWSANLGIGVEFMVGKHLGIYIDPSARYYFKSKQPKSIRTSQPFMLGCEMGFRTRF